MKFRDDFVTNSSSSSFVVVRKGNHESLDYYAPNLTVDYDFGETEFGWGPAIVKGIESRIIFAYLQTLYANREDWKNMLTKVIIDNSKVEEVIYNIDTEYHSDGGYVYIDHQSSASEGENIEIFDNEEILTDFIFSSQSYIALDNDNH